LDCTIRLPNAGENRDGLRPGSIPQESCDLAPREGTKQRPTIIGRSHRQASKTINGFK
jgi:hypothetical protein